MLSRTVLLLKQENHESHSTWVKHHRNRNVIVALVVVGVLSMVVLAVSSLGSSAGVKVGQTAPDFTAQDINNSNFHLYGHLGTPVLLEFMRTTCSHCMNEAPTLTSLYSSYQSHMVFVSISVDPTGDTASAMSSFAQTYGQSWTFIRDVSGLTGTYGVSGTPTMFLLDKNCVVRYSFVGETSMMTLQSAVQSLT
jgi:cytochrome c biogenesis protein CcmG, thiol:disulfide interchange protein DsbE